MRYAFVALKLVVEPGGAVSLAALLAGRIGARRKTSGWCCRAATSTRPSSRASWPESSRRPQLTKRTKTSASFVSCGGSVLIARCARVCVVCGLKNTGRRASSVQVGRLTEVLELIRRRGGSALFRPA